MFDLYSILDDNNNYFLTENECLIIPSPPNYNNPLLKLFNKNNILNFTSINLEIE
jgi:hypothetical protein